MSVQVEFGVLKETAGAGHGRQVLSAWEYPKEGGGYKPCLNDIGQSSVDGM